MRGVPHCFRISCQRVPRRITNFGSGGTRHGANPGDLAPFWDGNEAWLVLIGAGLFAAFPMVYAIFLSAFYLPITLMLFGLIFRGAVRRSRDFRNSGRIYICGGQIFVQSRGGAGGAVAVCGSSLPCTRSLGKNHEARFGFSVKPAICVRRQGLRPRESAEQGYHDQGLRDK